jgi:hypothetical protein
LAAGRRSIDIAYSSYSNNDTRSGLLNFLMEASQFKAYLNAWMAEKPKLHTIHNVPNF